MPIWYAVHGKRILYIFCDAAVAAVSYAIAICIAAYPDMCAIVSMDHRTGIALMVIAYCASLYFFKIYRIIWKYFNVRDMCRLAAANATGFCVFTAMMLATGSSYSPPAAVLALFFNGFFTGAYRTLVRGIGADAELPGGDGADAAIDAVKGTAEEKRILIAGAGDAGSMLLAEYAKRGLERCVVGFVDDDRAKIGKMLNGKMVFSSTGGVNDVIRNKKITEVVIAMPSVGAAAINRIIADVRREHPRLLVKTLPSFTRIFEKSLLPDLRELGIADLLGREEFGIDVQAIQNHFTGATVLVTGAGGSIGSELCRQLLKFNIRRLIAVGRGEFSIYTLAKSLQEHMYYLESETEIVYRIADVKDRGMLNLIFGRYRPDIVFHAAAHKHVPLMEFNEIEAIQNNVIGSFNVFEAALANHARECVLISTDKAVHPVNVMGATKRAAELMARYYFEKGLTTSIVRFGNVIGSRGSVIPLFREQIEKGGPVTVTHPEVTRYFMSIPEASILVINAAAYSKGGEVFVLDMGKQYRVADIARNLIRFYGYEPDRDIKIEYTGLRPGEKLYEELFYPKENLVKTQNEKIYILNAAGESYSRDGIERWLSEEYPCLYECDSRGARRLLNKLVPEFENGSDVEEYGPNPRLVN